MFDVHPFQAPLVLLRAAFLPVPAWRVAYGALSSAALPTLAVAAGSSAAVVSALSSRTFRAYQKAI